MFQHIVLWKFKEYANEKSKEENIQICRENLYALRAKIPQIRHMEVGADQLHTAASYDMILISGFDSQEDYFIYRDHPDHIAAGKYLSSCVTDRVCIDYEVGD
jgi:hypothetical protein